MRFGYTFAKKSLLFFFLKSYTFFFSIFLLLSILFIILFARYFLPKSYNNSHVLSFACLNGMLSTYSFAHTNLSNSSDFSKFPPFGVCSAPVSTDIDINWNKMFVYVISNRLFRRGDVSNNIRCTHYKFSLLAISGELNCFQHCPRIHEHWSLTL